jgi:hypothetical protein
VTEKIRGIRRLGFLKQKRIDATYEEHAKILKLILGHRASEACVMVRAHVVQNRMEVRKITIHMLHEAREAALSLRNPAKNAALSRRRTKSDRIAT